MGNKKKYVLRVYLNDKYYIKDSNDFRFELDFIDYLIKDHGIPTVQPIKAKNGDWLSQIRFGELPQEGAAIKTTAATNNFIRHAALFEYAPGIEVANNNMELTPAHFKILGELQARIHQAADQFTNPNNHHRYQQDVSTYLLDEPLKTLERELSRYNMQQQMDFFKPTAQAIRDKVAKLPKEKPYYGLNHGDLHPGNMFWDDATQTFTVIDWDHSAYGWRVYDSASMVSPHKLTFFLMGYESVRPLSPEEKEAIPLFRLLRDIWDFGDILAFQPLWGDDNASDENRKEELRGYLDRLRRVATAFEEQYGDGKAAVNQANTF
ncbi:Homoserine kinase [Seminavis robusta]|uniref:Homoserine kinase n=1 Tax=Seminavis robusta TaxID=568900 RepID=A0A9N8HAU6_9STRA|nr:Homoserine kinase [Seminavis robusta]|eukprot:Sro334_g119830.1 Homoserine kinase (321) ;mRNA; f:45557-46519